jgi:hypothetical protein
MERVEKQIENSKGVVINIVPEIYQQHSWTSVPFSDEIKSISLQDQINKLGKDLRLEFKEYNEQVNLSQFTSRVNRRRGAEQTPK